ncbi:MAG: hypothetical protein VX981_03910 [Chloroflexota bacterium]|nr:hypothetical protein [Chloroflexota bacterium]
MMDGMESIRRTIYDKFGNVMKTFKLDLDNVDKSNPVSSQDFPADTGLPEGENISESSNTDALWDLSELDPEIYEDVFEPTIGDGTPPLLQNTVVSSDRDDSVIENSADPVVPEEPPTFEKPKNFQTVSLDDIDGDDADENSGEINEPEEEDVESPLVSAANINDSDAEKSDMGDLFAEKIEVRPQVRQLLDKYGTISIDQLTKEIKEVAELLARK